MPARVPNPRKQFQFNIILLGLDPFEAQEVKLPDDEFDMVEHGDVGYNVKTAGMRKVSNLTISRILNSIALNTYIKDWVNRIRNFTTGGGELPVAYKQVIIVEEYAPDGLTVIDRHVYNGCWPQKVNGRDLSRKSSENTIESLEFCVDDVV